MVELNRNDLEFILEQIKTSEAHSAGTELSELVTNALVPYGLRTVDGSFNNLGQGQAEFGSADGVMQRLLEAQFRDADIDPRTGLPTSYLQTSGSVYDSDPRTISNLIVDQTIGNPATVISALIALGNEDPYAVLAIPVNKIAYDGAVTSFNVAQLAAKSFAVAQASGIQVIIDAAQAVLDQANEAKLAAYAYLNETIGITFAGDTVQIPNVSADLGDTAPFNGFFTLFGQFFDHGLDLVSKGGSGTVYVPLQPDDPLYVPGSPTNFMVLTRATNQPGADGVVGTADDVREHNNETTPWIDLNQVYTSNASHQVFLREYVLVDGKPVATGRMLEGTAGGPPTWADIKQQAAEILGITLTDMDVLRVPLIATDLYGEFQRDADGMPQLVTANAEGTGTELVSGNIASPVAASQALSAGRAFLNDIAHNAVPSGPIDHDRNPATAPVEVLPDADDVAGNPIIPNMFGFNLTYDNELLDRHFIVGDGRGNENIGLTSVHHLFHHEHNRQVEEIKQTVLATGDRAFINEWLAVDLAADAPIPTDAAGLIWDGERLFQASRFSTEMVYQHLVFEEFARAVAPNVEPFLFSNSVDIDPAITAEFAHVVYRFGHSMLDENIDRLNLLLGSDDTVAGVEADSVGLIQAFLNPIEFGNSGVDAEAAAGAILRGMTRQVGNEIDEYVTHALRNNLVGLPLDLATINLTRARETGIPSLNAARREFYADTQDTILRPYESWYDFTLHIKTPASLINFVAAYGTHASILGATTLEAKRDAATLLVLGGEGAPADRLDFLNSTGAWASGADGVTTTGLDDVDFWIGGLAEKKMPFGGMLGSTFTLVFETQMEKLQNGDRFYYLSRAQGLNLLNELEADSFAQLIKRNTDTDEGGLHVNGAAFQTAEYVLEMDQSRQYNEGLGGDDPTGTNPVLEAINPLVIRRDLDSDGDTDYIRFTGGEHVVLGGTGEDDVIIAGEGDDTLWGGAGNDTLEGGFGVDHLHGGDGHDIITDSGTDVGAADVIHGDDGDDVINAGNGLDLVFAGDGSDFVYGGSEAKTVLGGEGNDFIRGPSGISFLAGNEGDDWIEGGESFDTLAGENSELFFNSTIIGHDVLNGRGNDTDYDGESGDDIMFQGLGIERNNGMAGFDWAIHKGNAQAADSDMNISIFTNQQDDILRDRFDLVEGLSGWEMNDTLIGREVVVGAYDENGNAAQIDPNAPLDSYSNALLEKNLDLVSGLRELTDHLERTSVTVAGVTELIVMDTSDASDILLGGGGSDLMEGRAGNDIIDGDQWLNVRILVSPDASRAQTFSPFSIDSLDQIQARMFSGEIRGSQLQIVREIVDGGIAGDVDTAVFWDLRENYSFTLNADGSVTAEHVTVTAGVVDPATGGNRLSDGIDRLFNIEEVQFGDGTFAIGDLINSAATGAPVISDPTPTEGSALTVDTTSIADTNGLGAFTYVWQSSADAVTWTDIPGATGPGFTPDDNLLTLFGDQAGLQLRVVVSFTDAGGNLETLISEPTAPVGVNWTAIAPSTFNGTAGDDIANGSVLGADTLNGNGGNDVLNGATGNDTLAGGAGNDTLNGGAGANDTAVLAGAVGNFSIQNNGASIVVTDVTGAEGVDTLTGIETLRFNGVNYAVVSGTAGANSNLNGANGAAGSQAVFGLGGADSLNGGAGNDFLHGGDGNDTVTQTGSTGGRDIVDGGVGVDTYQLNGAAGSETFTIYARAAALAAITGLALRADTEIVVARNGVVIAELDNIEEIRVNTLQVTSPGGAGGGSNGGDTIQVVGDFTGTSLNFSTITIDGDAADDTIDISSLGSAHRIVFRSNGGTDTIIGTLRPQDVIELPSGATAADYELVDNGNGTQTLASAGHSVTFASNGMPAIRAALSDSDGGTDDDDDDDDRACGDDDPGPNSGGNGADETISPFVVFLGTGIADTAIGGILGDMLAGGLGDDTLFGLDGDDNLAGGEGGDTLLGGNGRDVVIGDAGDDTVLGGAGDDTILGGAGDDTVFGDEGNDLIFGHQGRDILNGGAGNDTIHATGGDGDDAIHGGDSIDTIDYQAITAALSINLATGSATSAQSGQDTLSGIENVKGGAGADVIVAGTAVNVLDGGGGNDVFVFNSVAAADGDTIERFAPGDTIDLRPFYGELADSEVLDSGAAFTASGQVRLTIDGNDTLIEGNTDADVSDFEFAIRIASRTDLSGSDFA